MCTWRTRLPRSRGSRSQGRRRRTGSARCRGTGPTSDGSIRPISRSISAVGLDVGPRVRVEDRSSSPRRRHSSAARWRLYTSVPGGRRRAAPPDAVAIRPDQRSRSGSSMRLAQHRERRASPRASRLAGAGACSRSHSRSAATRSSRLKCWGRNAPTSASPRARDGARALAARRPGTRARPAPSRRSRCPAIQSSISSGPGIQASSASDLVHPERAGRRGHPVARLGGAHGTITTLVASPDRSRSMPASIRASGSTWVSIGATFNRPLSSSVIASGNVKFEM